MDRRQFLQYFNAGLSAAVVPIPFISCGENNDNEYTDSETRTGFQEPPNFIIFMADDAGWADVGFHGSLIKTPNIDAMAAEGVELDRFYVSAVCSPTRAALLTGRLASRFGINSPLQHIDHRALPPGTLTIAGHLQSNGYDTALIGKWHLGMTKEHIPNNFGFNHTYGYLGPWLDSWSHLVTDFQHSQRGMHQWHRNGELFDEVGHVTDLITQESKRYLTEVRDKNKPFFLFVPYSAPHLPVQEERRWLDMYDGIIENESRQQFAASVTHMDDSIGQILAALRSEGLEENTVVMFFSDNGGQEGKDYSNWLRPPIEHNTVYKPTDVCGDNRPLRSWKGTHYEGGIRVPSVIKWPAVLPASKCGDCISVIDLFPTIAGLAGCPAPDDIGLEGENVWPLISGDQKIAGERILYWRLRWQMAVRVGDWKLIHFGRNPDDGRDELYNVTDDPYEKHEQSAEKPQIVTRLKDELRRQFAMDGEPI